MGTLCSLTLYARSREHADMSAAIAVAEAERINDKYSRYRSTSVLSELNRAAGKRRPVLLENVIGFRINRGAKPVPASSYRDGSLIRHRDQRSIR